MTYAEVLRENESLKEKLAVCNREAKYLMTDPFLKGEARRSVNNITIITQDYNTGRYTEHF
jgi:hypothetical protein